MSQFLKQQKSPSWKDIRYSLSILLAFFASWVSLWMFLRLVAGVGDSWRAVRLGNYVTVWLIVPLLFALMVAIALRHRWLMICLTLLLALSIHQNQLWSLPAVSAAPITKQTNELRVMTFNVHPTNQHMDALAELILQSQLDLVGLQEINRHAGNELVPLVAAEFPYVARQKGMMLFSRYPIYELPPLRGVLGGQLVKVYAPTADVYVWNLHAPTAVQQSFWEKQKRELSIVERHLAKTDAPLLLLGDLNATDQTENYNLIASHLTDTHVAAGEGLGLTYPEPGTLYTRFPAAEKRLEWLPTLLRIDYIFVSEHWQVHDSEVVTTSFGSDHSPIVATIGLR